MQNFLMLYVPFGSIENATSVAKYLVTHELCACANLLPAGISFYQWKGEFSQDQEHFLILKSVPKNKEKIIKKVMELHDYELPAIIEIKADIANNEYLNWIEANTKG